MNDRLNATLRSPVFTHAVTGVTTLGIGVFIGYVFGRRVEVQGVGVHDYPVVSVAESDLSPETLKLLEEKRRNGSVIQGARPIKVTQPEPAEEDEEVPHGAMPIDFIEVVEEEDVTLIRRTVFAQDGPNWDMEAELALRKPGGTYVLHQDEFYEGETDNLQLTFTYYGMDDVLADQDEVPVHNPEERIGPFFWGHGSDSPKKFFVRNESRKEEYEILHEPDLYYMVEVRGLELEEVEEQSELKHSSAPPKMRSVE